MLLLFPADISHVSIYHPLPINSTRVVGRAVFECDCNDSSQGVMAWIRSVKLDGQNCTAKRFESGGTHDMG